MKKKLIAAGVAVAVGGIGYAVAQYQANAAADQFAQEVKATLLDFTGSDVTVDMGQAQGSILSQTATIGPVSINGANGDSLTVESITAAGDETVASFFELRNLVLDAEGNQGGIVIGSLTAKNVNRVALDQFLTTVENLNFRSPSAIDELAAAIDSLEAEQVVLNNVLLESDVGYRENIRLGVDRVQLDNLAGGSIGMIQTKGWSSFYNGERGASVEEISLSDIALADGLRGELTPGLEPKAIVKNVSSPIPGGGTATMEMAWFETTGLVNGYALNGEGGFKNLVMPRPDQSLFPLPIMQAWAGVAFGELNEVTLNGKFTSEFDQTINAMNMTSRIDGKGIAGVETDFTLSGIGIDELQALMQLSSFDERAAYERMESLSENIGLVNLGVKLRNYGLLNRALVFMEQQSPGFTQQAKDMASMQIAFTPLPETTKTMLTTAVDNFIDRKSELSVSVSANQKPVRFMDMQQMSYSGELFQALNIEAAGR